MRHNQNHAGTTSGVITPIAPIRLSCPMTRYSVETPSPLHSPALPSVPWGRVASARCLVQGRNWFGAGPKRPAFLLEWGASGDPRKGPSQARHYKVRWPSHPGERGKATGSLHIEVRHQPAVRRSYEQCMRIVWIQHILKVKVCRHFSNRKNDNKDTMLLKLSLEYIRLTAVGTHCNAGPCPGVVLCESETGISPAVGRNNGVHGQHRNLIVQA